MNNYNRNEFEDFDIESLEIGDVVARNNWEIRKPVTVVHIDWEGCKFFSAGSCVWYMNDRTVGGGYNSRWLRKKTDPKAKTKNGFGKWISSHA